jgi:hypothetical protein
MRKDGLTLNNYCLLNKENMDGTDISSDIKQETVIIHMTGWKTKSGAILTAISGVIFGISSLIPSVPGNPCLFEFIGYIAVGLGAGFISWGIGHKLEKNRNILVERKRVPYYIHPMNEGEFTALETMRKKDLKDRQGKVMNTLKSPLNDLVS